MAEKLVNPLEHLGVPKWFIEEELAKTPPGLENIRALAMTSYRRYSRFYHPDTGTTPNVERFQQIALLAEQLADLETLEVWANYLIDTGSLYYQQARNLAIAAEAQARDRSRALLGMLPAVSPFTVLGVTEPMELIFGLPLELHVGIQGTYDQTFVLQVKELGSAPVSELLHPWEDHIVTPFAYSEGVLFDAERGLWCAYHMVLDDDDDGVLEPSAHYHEHNVPLGEARLIGGVKVEEVYSLAAKLHLMKTDDALKAIVGSGGRSSGLGWVPSPHAWWIPVMRPELRVGDFGVVINTATAEPRVALIGQLMATRRLLTS
jgi:hypothetical protein